MSKVPPGRPRRQGRAVRRQRRERPRRREGARRRRAFLQDRRHLGRWRGRERRCRARSDGRAERGDELRRHPRRGPRAGQGRPDAAQDIRDHRDGEPGRQFQRRQGRRRADADERTRRGRRTRRDRQHRVGRRLRGTDRASRVFGLEGRHRRHDPADGTRIRTHRRARDDHRTRRIPHPDGGWHARADLPIAVRAGAVSIAARQAGRIRLHRRLHPGYALPERQRDPAGWRNPDAAEMKASDVKKGNVVEHEGTVYQVRDIQRSAPTARGGNVTFRFTLYSIPEGRKFDLSLRADDDLKEMELVRRAVNYSYKDGDAFVFLDAEDYTPYALDPSVVGDGAAWIVESVEGYYVQLIDDAPVALQVPTSVALKVVDTAPELTGASATKRTKPAKLDTGVEIQVPEYIATGEKVWVNTLTGEFAGRA